MTNVQVPALVHGSPATFTNKPQVRLKTSLTLVLLAIYKLVKNLKCIDKWPQEWLEKYL